MIRRPPSSTLFPYTPLSRSDHHHAVFERLLRDQPANLLRLRVLAEIQDGHRSLRGIELPGHRRPPPPRHGRSEEHTSELQSPCNLVCRLLLEKKQKTRYT